MLDVKPIVEKLLDYFILELGKWYGEKESKQDKERLDGDELFSLFCKFCEDIQSVDLGNDKPVRLEQVQSMSRRCIGNDNNGKDKDLIDERKNELKQFISKCMKIPESKNSCDENQKNVEAVFKSDMIPHFIYYMYGKKGFGDITYMIGAELSKRHKIDKNHISLSLEAVLTVLSAIEQLDNKDLENKFKIKLSRIYEFLDRFMFYENDVLLRQKTYLRYLLKDDEFVLIDGAKSLCDFVTYLEIAGVKQDNLNFRILKEFNKGKIFKKVKENNEVLKIYPIIHDDAEGDFRTIPRLVDEYFGEHWNCIQECCDYMNPLLLSKKEHTKEESGKKEYDVNDQLESAVRLSGAITHKMKLHAEPFEKIKSGVKNIELRLFDEKRQKIKAGDNIIFTNTVNGEKMRATVKMLHRFDSFEELYKALPLLQCGYTKENIDIAHPSDMEQYYSVEEQQKYGVVGIELFPPILITEEIIAIMMNRLRLILFLELDLKKDSYISILAYRMAEHYMWKFLETCDIELGKIGEERENTLQIKEYCICASIIFNFLVDKFKQFLEKFEKIARRVEKKFRKQVEKKGICREEDSLNLFERTLCKQVLLHYASVYLQEEKETGREITDSIFKKC